jgi:hypothetical protein
VIDYLRRTPTLARLLRSLAVRIGGFVARVVLGTFAAGWFLWGDTTSRFEVGAMGLLFAALLYLGDVHDELTARRDAQ